MSLVGCIQNNTETGGGGEGGTGGTGGIAGMGGGGVGGGGGEECVPGSSFMAADGCNQCQCPESGLVAEAACTERACIEQCEPGTEFGSDDGCNTCVCPESGIRADAACTDRACVDPCEGVQCGGACEPGGDRPGMGGAPADAPINPGYACNQAGECMRGFSPDLCEEINPCEGSACGDRCSPVMRGNADSDEFAPQRLHVCDADLNCVPAEAENIQCENRCDGRSCGEPCGPAANDGANDEELEAVPAPGLELCNAQNECVFVEDADALQCDGPSPCDGIACGEPCILSNTPGTMPGPGEQPEGEDEPADPSVPVQVEMGFCDSRGSCVPASEPVDLMCEEERCEPGSSFEAEDGCNTCACPESGIRAEAACTEAACGPDPRCEGLVCGEECGEIGPNSPPDGEADPAPPARLLCDANLRCISEHLHEGCGM